ANQGPALGGAIGARGGGGGSGTAKQGYALGGVAGAGGTAKQGDALGGATGGGGGAAAASRPANQGPALGAGGGGKGTGEEEGCSEPAAKKAGGAFSHPCAECGKEYRHTEMVRSERQVHARVDSPEVSEIAKEHRDDIGNRTAITRAQLTKAYKKICVECEMKYRKQEPSKSSHQDPSCSFSSFKSPPWKDLYRFPGALAKSTYRERNRC
ncbi:MAG: hypothetical protein GY772_29735, partial [bacterium]|nr:hypothetical protein [bacterium]